MPRSVLEAFHHDWGMFYFTLGKGKPQKEIDELWFTHHREIIGHFHVQRIIRRSFPPRNAPFMIPSAAGDISIFKSMWGMFMLRCACEQEMPMNKLEPFRVAEGKMIKTCRHKVKRPRITAIRFENNKVIVLLSCGHEKVIARVPKWTSCYKCPVETIHFEEPVNGFREIPFTTTRPQ